MNVHFASCVDTTIKLSYLAEYYRDYVVGRRSEFDLDVTFAHKNNRKVKALLYEQARKHHRFDLLTTSQINAIIRSKYSYMMSKAKGKTVVSPKTTCRSRIHFPKSQSN
ncbi:hypothetical protein G6F57_020575 [Rhizopus arrhizus]|nr:hypothetical protein G6F28_013097 [Rhizopus arrhizus]KAG0994680.1 hypothetical protein G6F27_014065 [Rhizopus arrhizus]KAG1016463.1 hypothetical protein G6F25_014083 [Rhizopus arrhizus]KAG1058658.1 hypothetical protein G6F41_013839 [Rhizopus arrhizus]KAG1081304.1 hypothetical protein G6F39_013934 [Rhizopus arrhizus]